MPPAFYMTSTFMLLACAGAVAGRGAWHGCTRHPWGQSGYAREAAIAITTTPQVAGPAHAGGLVQPPPAAPVLAKARARPHLSNARGRLSACEEGRIGLTYALLTGCRLQWLSPEMLPDRLALALWQTCDTWPGTQARRTLPLSWKHDSKLAV